MKPILKTLGSAVLAALTLAGCARAQVPATAPATAQVLDWNGVALEAVERSKVTQHQVVRLMTYLSLAQHAALTEAPADGDALVSASSQVIATLLPAQAAFIEERRRQQAPSAASSERGTRIAARVLDEARQDGFDRPWTGSLPTAPGAWHSLVSPPAAPAYPAVGGMRTFLIPSGDSLRAAPPPTADSRQFADDLAEIRRHVTQPTEESTRLARFFDMTTGKMAGGFWNERAVSLIRSEPAPRHSPTQVLATLNMAMMDALVACHDSKYAYWVARPTQADPTLKPLIGVPNHPSYPSNHSCLSTTAGQVLAQFFPAASTELAGIAQNAGLSRIYAGLHYRFDLDAGARIGRAVAVAAQERQQQALSRFASTTISQR